MSVDEDTRVVDRRMLLSLDLLCTYTVTKSLDHPWDQANGRRQGQMALVIGKLGMNNSGGQSLHPFFTQNKVVPTNPRPTENVDASPTLQSKPAASPDVSLLPGVATLPRPRKRRKNSGNRQSNTTDNGTEAVLHDQKLLLVEKSALSKIHRTTSLDQKDTAVGLESDPNGSRRKRQRTASPDPEAPGYNVAPSSAWQEQLTAAAFDDNSDDATQPTFRLASLIQSKGLEPTGKDAHPNTSLKIHDDWKPISGQAPVNNSQNGIVSADAPPPTQSLQPQWKPSKKMLRVRSDGRLASPKSKIKETVSGQKVRSRSRQAKTKPQKWVVLRFGSNTESRRLIAQKIEQILLGPVKKSCIVPGPDAAKSTSKALALVGPPKPTHPFFLGSSVQLLNPKMLMTSNDETKMAHTKYGKTAIESDNSQAPSAKPVVKLKKGTNAWATFGGFGSRSLAEIGRIVAKTEGAQEPLWPPLGMSHVRGLMGPSMPQVSYSCRQLADNHKLKEAKVSIAEHDSILYPLAEMVHAYKLGDSMLYSRSLETLRRPRPKRRVMTGRQLQRAIRPSLYYLSTEQTQSPQVISRHEDALNGVPDSPARVHPAIRRTYDKIAHSLTAFDKCECETQEWAQKYAPKSAADVLQQGREVTLLRDWLQSLRIKSVGNSTIGNNKIRRSSDASRRPAKGPKRKRKKKEDLNGFLVSSDDEANEMEELSDFPNMESMVDSHFQSRRSLVRTGGAVNSPHNGEQAKTTNAVIVSGPHGCGKTAAIYAVAEELGFEVFEINAGSRRNGKDLMERVGDMSQNHLVHRACNIEVATNHATDDNRASEEELRGSREALKRDLASGRQGTVNSFFRRKTATKKEKSKDAIQALAMDTKKNQGEDSKRQSLVLLEEVDVLFDEDKQFWATTLDLLLQSKRPIVMTCTDESLLPLDRMTLHAIFRFSTASKDLAVDYLLLIAANEGHLLSRNAVSMLYEYKKHDLRASLTELNFFCQMAVGDRKGGLEWMLIRSSPKECRDKSGEQLRVVSEGTYQEGMGFFGSDCAYLPSGTIEQQTDLITAAWNDWDIDLEDCIGSCSITGLPHTTSPSQQARLNTLETFEQAVDSLSATDTFPGFGFRHDLTACLDPSFPELTDKMRENFDNSAILLNASQMVEQSQMSTSLALTLRVCANRAFAHDCQGLPSPPIDETVVRNKIIEAFEKCRSQASLTRPDIIAIFDPIARPAKGLNLSSFDGPMSMVMEDLAPYVRGIVYYDIRLEEQRLRLSSLLSEGARNGKKIRTTRASRAALEGGSKAHTRRERWFPKETNFTHILRSGREDWQQSLWLGGPRGSLDGEFDGSRRSSMVSGTGSET